MPKLSSNSAEFSPAKPKAQSPNRMQIHKEQLMSGLYLIATPIGNLRDISLRALDILSSIDILLCEDTRRAGKLLTHYGIKADMDSYHDHNVAEKLPYIVKAIKSGKSVGLISDAGTPLINDPGYKLARACIEAELDVIAVPGASAVLAGLVSSGLPPDRFMFAGFLPPKSSARKTVLSGLENIKSTLVFFETAKRINKSLADIADIMPGRQIVIARELTKKYEQILRASAEELLAKIKTSPLKGEIVLLIAPPNEQEKWSEEKIISRLEPLLAARSMNLGMKKASAIIAGQSGWPARDIYKIALKIKPAGKNG